jgi:Integrase core domain
MDRAATHQCLSLERDHSISAARPRWELRRTFPQSAEAIGIKETLTAPRSPWQNAYVEKLIGSFRRDCLDHVLVFNERGLRRILKSYFDYYERSRTHLSLAKDAPIPRPVEPPALGKSDCNSPSRQVAPSLRTLGRITNSGQNVCNRNPSVVVIPSSSTLRSQLLIRLRM